MITIAASGGFDPLHIGHVEYLQHAKALGTNVINADEGGFINEARLVVIVNSDEFLIRKKGYAFMPLKERMAIVSALRCVDEVIACIDKDQTVCETLRMLKPDIFAKGGDRHSGNIPELAVCQECGIEIVDGLGQKIQSSSELVKKIKS